MDTASLLAPLTVLNLQGAAVPLGPLWSERAAVLVFIRHFGWMLCKQQVAQLRGFVDPIRARGAELILIGSGSVEQANAFYTEQQLQSPLFTDPSRRTYLAAGFASGLSSVVTIGTLRNGVRAFRQGFRQSATQGDPFQQGGALVFAKGGACLFTYRSQEAGDHPDPAALVAALPAVP